MLQYGLFPCVLYNQDERHAMSSKKKKKKLKKRIRTVPGKFSLSVLAAQALPLSFEQELQIMLSDAIW